MRTTINISVYLEPEIVDALDKECERQNRSRSNLVGIYVRKALSELSEEDVKIRFQREVSDE
jgi:metal-responsive CopG/Arc/MetJ family transcriptional regulator